MRLLDEVLGWDARHIRCRSASHRLDDHPLRVRGHIGIVCGIEYVAQAMAVHGAIGAGPSGGRHARAEVGILAGLREVRMHAARLDDIESDLICEAHRIAGDASTAIYGFSLSARASSGTALSSSAGLRPLLEGRATVLLDARQRLSL
jgi:predicted hotdog family 3-hydroxylacyl-ACP dehydratase